MKRFLMFLVIAIAVVSLGLTIYYFSVDNEVIYIKSSYLVVEVGEDIRANDEVNDLVDFKHRSEYTTLSYKLEQPKDKEVLVYNQNEGFFTAQVGGESKIIIQTNNRNYSRLVVDVLVCDGTSEYPYIIKSEEDLKKIGNQNETKYTTSASYKLGNDITLTEEWTPISSYSGTFDGNYFTIDNMTITNQSLIHNSEAEVTATPLSNQTAITNAGFISVLESSGVVKNLFLTNVDINCSVEYMGAFAGSNFGLIQTSEATGSIKNNLVSSTAYIGGVAGRTISDNKKAKIDRCGFEGEMYLSGTQQVAGGVTGQNQSGTVSETYARLTNLSNGSSKFGGIVGLNQGTNKGTADIYDSYFYLTQKQSNTVYNNIGGITYNNQETTSRNMVTGNYNGGVYAKNQVENLTKEGSFESASNGYLVSSIVAGDNEVEFVNKDKFITTKSTNEEEKPSRKWNFNSVWEIPNNAQYPILNVFSSVGSTYIIDVSDILTGNQITSAQHLYDVLSDEETTDVYEIASDISLDPNGAGGFVWGDAEHPIPDTFHGTLINPNGYEIKSLTLKNTTPNSNVGLVKNLASGAIISGIIIKDVTIIGESASYVGVLAGESYGASVYNTTIQTVNVNLNCLAFGTFFGYATDVAGHGIKDVKAKFVNMSNGYALYAGGIVGINLTTITAETNNYNDVYHIELVANYAGGVVGANGGKIEKTSAQEILFNQPEPNNINLAHVYNGYNNVFVGGIVAVNDFTAQSSNKSKGTITDVYANIEVKGKTATTYKMYIGGVAGYNSSTITRAYVTQSTFTITGSQNVFVGGVTGYNSGNIANSVVDSKSSISTTVTASVGTSKDGGNYILNTSHCSIVGGIVGYDAKTSNSTYSIYQCASYMKNITGYYAGGIVGIALGKVEYSFCGESTKSNGGVLIHGYMAGGIAAVVANGFIKDCYTFCQLSSAEYGGKYTNVMSAVKMEVSCMGGITVFVLNKDTIVQGCYAVVSFKGNGVSWGTSADLTGYVCGTLKKCAYQNAGSQKTPYGTQISASNLKGNDGYYAFKNAVGSTQVWNLENGYPTLEGVNVRFPSSTIPNFH